MVVTLPAVLEINAFVSVGDEGIELCCLLKASGSIFFIHVSSQHITQLEKASPSRIRTGLKST